MQDARTREQQRDAGGRAARSRAGRSGSGCTSTFATEILAGPADRRAPSSRGRARRVARASAAARCARRSGRLAAEGLVTIRPRRGAVVRALSTRGVHRGVPGARGARDDRGPARRAAARTDETCARWSALIDEMVGLRTYGAMSRGSSTRTRPSTSSSSRSRGTGCSPDLYRQAAWARSTATAALARAARRRCGARSRSTRRSSAPSRQATSRAERSTSCPSTSACRRSACLEAATGEEVVVRNAG